MGDDADLLDAWRAGEQAAGRELFDKYIGRDTLRSGDELMSIASGLALRAAREG